MFEGFESATVDTGDTSIFTRRGGMALDMLRVMTDQGFSALVSRATIVARALRIDSHSIMASMSSG